MATKTRVEILDSNLNLITRLQTLVPLNSGGTILQYSKELSDFGTCRFRVSNYDPVFTNKGDILKPHNYHVRVKRGDNYVWQGAIIENAHRTKDYTEVVAVEYEWYLGKILVTRSSPDANGKTDIYRIFNSGTMAAAVTAIITETIAKYASTNHILKNLSLGTIDNPDYPPNMTDGNNPPHALSGPWYFGNGVAAPLLTYDFHSIMYLLKSLGAYSYADFNIDTNLKFNFRKFLGNDRHYDINFVWGREGNAVDFNLPRIGQNQTNDLIGIATDNNGTILHSEKTDEAGVTTNGYLQGVAAYSDVKDQATLNARVAAELPLISSAEESANTMTLDEAAYPFGVYDVGDIVSVKVKHIAVSYNQVRRIVGLTVRLHDTGRELTTVQMNAPRPGDYGGVIF